MHGVLHSICDAVSKGCLEAEHENQTTRKTKRHCPTKLLELVKKTWSGSTCVTVDDVVGSVLESLRNALLIRGDDCSTFPKCHEATQNRFEALEEDGLDMTSPKFRDAYISGLEDRGQCSRHTCLHSFLFRRGNRLGFL